MLPRLLFAALCLLAAVLRSPAGDDPPSAAEGGKFFEARIRPIFQAHCISCHGGPKPKGGLSLATRDTLLKGGDSGAVVSAHKPADSLLLKVVSHEGEVKMPPKGKLAPAQLGALAEWVRMGAPWPA